jgi:hypothetical protein
MADAGSSAREAIINDLLAETNLWQVYQRSRSIPFSRTNNVVGVALGVLLGLGECWSIDLITILDQLADLSTLIFNTTVSLLGFLLAGFSFFATVADKQMFCRMAEVPHEPSGLSYLKYNLFVFMRVFVEYLVLCIVGLVVQTSLQTGTGSRQLLEGWLSMCCLPGFPRLPVWIAAGAIGLLFGCFVYLLMQLKSFIFNIHHVVMTSIGWALENEPDDPDVSESALLENAPRDVLPTSDTESHD